MNEICDHIALDDSDAAERFFHSVVDLMEATLAQPRIGRVVPEYGRERVRERIHGKYRIVYWLRTDTIVVLAAYQCSRTLPENLL